MLEYDVQFVEPGPGVATTFTPYGANRDFYYYKGREAILHGPAETGKTFAALWKLHHCALKYPGASIVIARKTLVDARASVLQMFINKVLGHDRLTWPCDPYGGENPSSFDYPHFGKNDEVLPPARIWIAGFDKSSKLLSQEHDIIFINQVEDCSRDDWETATTRTTGRHGAMPYSQTLGDMNPSYPTNFMYHRDTIEMFFSKHENNPTLFDPATGKITAQGIMTMATLDALTGIRKERLRYGRVVQAEGAIYADWNENSHMVYERDLPKAFAFLFGSQDWGYTNPGCFGAWGVDGDGRMYLLAQIYRRNELTDWWADRVVELQTELCAKWRKDKFLTIECDPSEPEFIAKYKSKGLNAVGAFNGVRPGIEEVEARLKVKKDKKPRLMIVRGCSRWIDEELKAAEQPYRVEDEFPAYVWNDRKTREEPVKENDHGMDMVRYGAAKLGGLGKKRKRKVKAGLR